MRASRFAVPVVGLALLMAAGCAGTEEEAAPGLDQVMAMASEQGKLVLADFYTDW